MSLIRKQTDRKAAVRNAARLQLETGRCHYVVWSVPLRTYKVTDRMPLLGEWYSADGNQHGA